MEETMSARIRARCFGTAMAVVAVALGAVVASAQTYKDRKFNPGAIPVRRAEAPGAGAEEVAECA